MSDTKLTARDMEIVSKVFQCFQSPDAMKIDTEKLAQLAGFSNGKSANASWNVIKKKLIAGATIDGGAAATAPKKAKGKAANPENEDDNETASTKAAPKKRGKTIKTEPVDAEAGDADTEATPAAESPKKGRAKKATGAAVVKAEANDETPAKATTNGDTTNEAAATEVITPTPKRKRGPNKPKDPNATPAKRAKKGANAGAAAGADGDAANAQLHGAQTNEEGSIFGGDENAKEEDEDQGRDDRLQNAEEQQMADDALFNTYTTEEQAA